MKRSLSLRDKAMDYLSRREHSRAELKQKLAQKAVYAADDIDALLDALAKNNLQSDDRFVQSYVRYRRQQGFGPKRIAAELHSRGVAENLIDAYVDATDIEWKKEMIAAWQKKFSATQKNHAQQFRFLCQRGFTPEEVYRYLNKQCIDI